MTGGSSNYEYRGIIPRTLSLIFQEIDSRFDQQVSVKISYIEIYNELMFDLLSPTPTHEQSGNIHIVEDVSGNIKVKGLSLHTCSNEEEALSLLFEGDTNRTVSQHELNKNSSRSHCIFTLHVESKSRVESTEKVHVSKLNLVDLAGSERTKKTGSSGITLKEASFINKSLSFLEQVVVAVCDRHRGHVPYRQSKLTNLLKDSIGGNCKTLMIANIWPEASNLEETISTCKFATRMMSVSNQAVVNINQDPEVLLKKYEIEIRDLKHELNQTYVPEAPEKLFDLAKQFLSGSIEDVDDLPSIRYCRDLMHQMKLVYRKLEMNTRVGSSRHGNRVGDGTPGVEDNAIDPAELERRKTLIEEEGVGEEEKDANGFGVGKAPKESRPQHKLEMMEDGEQQEAEDESKNETEGEGTSEAGHPSRKSKRFKKKTQKSKQEAFKEYKVDEGHQLETDIKSNRSDLRNKKEKMGKLKDICNKSKKEIDILKGRLEEK